MSVHRGYISGITQTGMANYMRNPEPPRHSKKRIQGSTGPTEYWECLLSTLGFQISYLEQHICVKMTLLESLCTNLATCLITWSTGGLTGPKVPIKSDQNCPELGPIIY